ncbi:Ca-transporting ATPase [Reticulomyxa filosa]|uniref:Ca-transporting ATPase n=1 Tax=Reticulomyxa filosa TaxID=46433 RepID=X6M710_RETFI|nr:Ca-transporting ATPase [Reticulomyxa filosa]|eukprot:ETO09386.1 Ca-transporting ATPase [Reticulomyxa filosa]
MGYELIYYNSPFFFFFFEKKKKNGAIHWHITGEPTEGALKVLAEKMCLPDVKETERLQRERDRTRSYQAVDTYWQGSMRRERVFEFTRDRRSMSVFVRHTTSNEGWLLVKGAPESLLDRSTHILVSSTDSAVEMTEVHKAEITRVYHDFASEGLRCLGVAFKSYNTDNEDDEQKVLDLDTEDYSEMETKLTFVGVIGMLDPPRPQVKEAIRVCHEAGIRVIVVTGDNKKTAEAICRDIGLFERNENLVGKSYTGADLTSLSEVQQNEAIQTASLFSRVMPKHKQQLVDLLQKHKEVVAMTGDGVNDAPALKKADIGIGMGSGTEVAKHAADMILSDDNFATIVSAVEEGRAIYANTKQFIRYLISSNIGEVVCIFLTAALGFPEALIPVQLLWVNLVTDGLPATALSFNKPDQDIMTIPPRGRTEKIINGWTFFRYLLIGSYVGIATIAGFYWWFCWYSNGPLLTFGQLTHFYACNQTTDTSKLYFSNWQGNCNVFHDFRPCTVSLSILVTIEMFNTFNALSENQSLLTNPPWSNMYVVFAVTLSMALHMMILYVPTFQTMFSTTPLNTDEWWAVVLISFPVVLLDELLKLISRFDNVSMKKRNKGNASPSYHGMASANHVSSSYPFGYDVEAASFIQQKVSPHKYCHPVIVVTAPVRRVCKRLYRKYISKGPLKHSFLSSSSEPSLMSPVDTTDGHSQRDNIAEDDSTLPSQKGQGPFWSSNQRKGLSIHFIFVIVFFVGFFLEGNVFKNNLFLKQLNILLLSKLSIFELFFQFFNLKHAYLIN